MHIQPTLVVFTSIIPTQVSYPCTDPEAGGVGPHWKITKPQGSFAILVVVSPHQLKNIVNIEWTPSDKSFWIRTRYLYKHHTIFQLICIPCHFQTFILLFKQCRYKSAGFCKLISIDHLTCWKTEVDFFVSLCRCFTPPSTIFQACQEDFLSSWVQPVLSSG